MRNRFSVFGFFAAFVSLLSIAGCDVGLGEVVDTQAPALEITYPPIAATIRDSFVLYGTWSDDKGVSSVSVKVVNTATKETVDSLSATVNSDKTWQIELNEFDSDSGYYKYKDGTYQVGVTAYDGAGHSSGESSRTFDIDNTAPVFVISKPGVVKSQNLDPSSYGSIFTIEGTIADDHAISLMDVKIYSESGECVSSENYEGDSIPFYREEEIATAGGTSVIIAQHSSSGDTTSANARYSQMYAGTEATQNFYAEISLTDSANIYKNPNGSERSAEESKNDSLGNSTSKVYLYDDVYTTLMSAKKGLGLSAADLKNILNGTKTDVPEALAALDSSAKDTSAADGNRLSFSLNPDASPKYQVNGFSYEFDSEKPLQTASSGNSLTVSISAGLDGTQILPQGYGKEGVKIWLRKYSERPSANSSSLDENAVKNEIQTLVGRVNALVKDENSAFVENGTKINLGDEENVKEWTLVYNYADHVERGGSSVSSKTFSVTVPEGIELGKYYVLALTGCDIEDVDFSQNTVYGFEGNQQGVAPTLKITSPDNLSITKDENVEFTGTASLTLASIYVKELDATLTVTDEDTGEKVGEVSATLTCNSTNNSNGTTSYTWSSQDDADSLFTWNTADSTWTFRPSKSSGFASIKTTEGKQYLYALSLTGKSSSGHTSDTASSVHIDKRLPAISISSAEPRVELYEPLGDSLKDKYIYLNGTVTIKGSIEEQNLSEVTYDIWASTDLTKELSESDSIFKLAESNQTVKAALDAAGLDQSLGKVYSISQKFDTSLISKIFAKAETPDPMILAEVVLMAEDTSGNKTTYLASKDPVLNGKTDSVAGKKFVIYQETDRPIIILENASADIDAADKITDKVNLFGTTSNNRLQVSFEDDDAINSIWVTLFDKDGNVLGDNEVYELYGMNPYKTTIGKTTYTLNYQLPAVEGTYQVRIDAFDSGSDIPADVSGIDSSDHNIRSVTPFFIAVDSGAPQIKISSPENETYTNAKGETGKFTLKGTVSKKLETKIECSVKDSAGSPVSSGYTFEASIGDKNASGTYDWTGSIILPENDGLYTLTLTASDTYSQKSSTEIKLGLDTQKPLWNGDGFKVGGKAFASGDSHTWYKSSTLQFEGKFTEAGSGIDHVEYSVTKAGETEPVTDTFAPNADGTFKQNLGEFIAKVTDGAATANKIKFLAVDKAGNKSDESEFDIYIDSEVPTVTADQSGSQYSNKSLEINVTGKAEDDSSGVESVTLTVTEDGQTTVKTTVNASSTDSFANWTATIPADFLAGLADKTYAVKATVTDKAGNKSSAKLFSIDVDAEKPTIKNVSLSDEGGTYSVYETKEKIDGADKTVYYIHSGNNFLLSGSVQDSKSGIKSIVVNDGTSDIVSQINGKDVTALPVTLDLSNYASAGSVTLKITATDNAGNTESQNVLVKIDDDAPKALHALDQKNKDVFFRIGDNDNDDIDSSSSLWSDSLDKGVGGKYSEGTYGNSKTIKIRGTLDDTGSGISMVYYKVVSDENASLSQEELNNISDSFYTDYKTDNTGYFAPGVASSEKERRVFYTGGLNDASENAVSLSGAEYSGFAKNTGSLQGGKNYATVTSNYSSVLSGFSTGKNYLILVYVDKVGNATLDSVKVGGQEHKNISLNVDENTPEASSSVEGIKYTNKKGVMELSGTASDAASGLYSITLKQGSKAIVLTKNSASPVENDNGKLEVEKDVNGTWNWKATVNNDKFFAGASGTVSVSLEAKDCAGIGNTKSINVATVIVDTQLDSITLSTPTDADSETEETQVNGTITLEGTMSDTNVLPAIAITKIEYKKTSDTNWTEASTTMPNLALSGSYTFKVEGFDTTKLSDNTEYQIRAVGTDSAGNEKASDEVSIIVSQDSDRPKVNFNNIDYNSSLGTFLLKHGTNSQVTGRISDDDADGSVVVKKFIVSETAYTGEEGESEPTNLLGSSLPSSGEFTITPSDTGDGEKTFYIYIEDNGGKKFYTTYTSASASATTNDKLQNPKILVKNEAASDGVESAVFKYISDSLNPSVGTGKGLPYSAEDDAEIAYVSATEKFDIGETNSNLNASFIAGGSARKFVKFYFTGSDASGISSMKAVFTDSASNELKTLEQTGDFTKVADGNEVSWTTDFIDVSSWTTGQISVDLTVTDGVGLGTTGSFSFYVDNTAPEIKITNPESGDEKTGSFAIRGSAYDTGNAGTENIYWIVPKKSDVSESSDEKIRWSVLKKLSWNGGDKSLASSSSVKEWEFDFDGSYDKNASDSDSFVFKAGNPLLDVYDSEDFATKINDGIYTLPVYFMAVDSLGNYSIKEDYVINHNPDGDRPKVVFTYPTKESYDSEKNFATLGGSISLTGSAEIPSGTTTVRSVYIQIADDNGKFNATDKSTAQTKYGFSNIADAYSVISAIKGTSYSSATMTDADAKNLGFASKADMDAWWGIEASGKASWRIQINSDGKMNPASGTETNNVKIRASAVNANGKMGAWTQGDNVLSVHIDNGVPVIMNQFVNQYAGSDGKPSAVTAVPAAAASASQLYTTDMFLRGKWTLVFDALDESGIESVTVKNGSAAVPFYKTETSETIDGTKKSGYRVFVPIDDSVTAITYSIEATEKGDTNPHSTRASFSFKIDNNAPTIEEVKNGKDEELAEGSKIANGNYVFTLKGTSDDKEDGSGVEYVAFYYMRKNGKTNSSIKKNIVFDPMIKPAGTNYEDGKVSLDGLSAIDFDGTEEKLYAKSVSGSVEADSNGSFNTFTASSALDAHIRAGGLVKIDGIIRKISSVSGSTVTFSPAATAASSEATALFPVAQVIDANNTAGDNSKNPFEFDNGKDDGDGMVESFTKSGSKWSWDATIHSDNMSDGPATLVILAFDNAGNVSSKSYNVMISNNAPRLAKVFLGTDLNHDDVYGENEFENYNIGAATGNTDGLDTYTLTTAGFKSYSKNASGKWVGSDSARKAFAIKNGLAVLPEIVGGNGDISLVFNASDTTAGDGKQTGSGTNLLENSGEIALSCEITGDKDSDENPVGITGKYWNIASAKLGTDGENRKMSFTFWDSTEETVSGTNSQYTFLRVEDFVVDQVDEVAPNVVVDPFFWESEDNNSLYENSKANGHIELESDLTEAIKTSLGDDPKVSGKIVIRGSAYDETLLGKLTFSMTNFKSSASLVMAEYKTTTGTDGKKTSAWSVSSNTMAANSYEVTVEDEYMNQNGHKVKWTVALDTSVLSDVAHKDAVFTVIANDQKAVQANSSAASTGTADGTTDATKHVPSYQMDVVPYITGIKTNVRSASGLKDNNIRSASGKYSILANNAENTITVKGFNFSTSKLVAKIANKAAAGGTALTSTAGGVKLTASASDTNTVTIANSGITKSGYLEIFSNGIRTLNNINENDAHDAWGSGSEIGNAITDYANYYNREPDYYTTKNVRLTDDRYLRFFDMKSTSIKNGYYPDMIMDGNDPVFGYVDLNGINASSYIRTYQNQCYQAQRTKFRGSDGTFTDIEYLLGAISTDQMAMVKDDAGKYIHATVYNYAGATMDVVYNDYAEDHTWNYYYTDGWAGGTGYQGYNGVFSYEADNNAISLETTSFGNGTLIGRYQNIRMAVKGNSTKRNGASVYMAYYDDNTTDKDVIFRTFKIGTNNNWTNRLNNGNTGTTGAYSNLADGNTDGRIVAGSSGSKYLDMAVTSDNIVVIVYYDVNDARLKLKYSSAVIDGSSTNPNVTWKESSVTFPDYVGTDVSLALDSNNGIHIAAFDAGDSDLMYMYMPSYDSSTLKTVRVDQASSVGNWTRIRMKDDVPYIAYYNSTEAGSREPIKLAYFADTENSIASADVAEIQGVDGSNYTTGKWEYMTIPALTPPQGSDGKFKQVNLDFDASGRPVVGYLGTNIEFGKALDE